MLSGITVVESRGHEVLGTSSIDGTLYNCGRQIMELLNAGPDINNAKPNVHMRDNTLDCVLNIFDSDAMNNDIAVTSLTEKTFHFSAG